MSATETDRCAALLLAIVNARGLSEAKKICDAAQNILRSPAPAGSPEGFCHAAALSLASVLARTTVGR